MIHCRLLFLITCACTVLFVFLSLYIYNDYMNKISKLVVHFLFTLALNQSYAGHKILFPKNLHKELSFPSPLSILHIYSIVREKKRKKVAINERKEKKMSFSKRWSRLINTGMNSKKFPSCAFFFISWKLNLRIRTRHFLEGGGGVFFCSRAFCALSRSLSSIVTPSGAEGGVVMRGKRGRGYHHYSFLHKEYCTIFIVFFCVYFLFLYFNIQNVFFFSFIQNCLECSVSNWGISNIV